MRSDVNIGLVWGVCALAAALVLAGSVWAVAARLGPLRAALSGLAVRRGQAEAVAAGAARLADRLAGLAAHPAVTRQTGAPSDHDAA